MKTTFKTILFILIISCQSKPETQEHTIAIDTAYETFKIADSIMANDSIDLKMIEALNKMALEHK